MNLIFKTTYRFNQIAIFCIVLGGYYYGNFFGLTSNLLLGITAPIVTVYIWLAISESVFILTNDQVIIKYPFRLFYRKYKIDLNVVSKVEIFVHSIGISSPAIKFYFSNGKRRKMIGYINPDEWDMKHLVNLIGQRGIKIKIWD